MKKVNDIDANIQYQQILDQPLTQDGGQNPNGYNPNGQNPNGYNPNGQNPNGYNPPNWYNPNGYDTNELQKLLYNIDIPDKVDFTHVFQLELPCCCDYCGKYLQSSSFYIQGMGELGFEFMMKKQCGQNCCKCKCDCCLCTKYCTCFDYYFPVEIYKMSNEKVSLEFWHEGLGKIQVNNKPVLEFYHSYLNASDECCASFCSSYPVLEINSPYSNNKTLWLKQSRNIFPEQCCSMCLCVAWLDVVNQQKKIFVEGLTQGKCEIVNSRTFCEALAKTTALQGCCCCPFNDYPKFSVKFENVPQIDKLAIILGLIHISYYKEWVIKGTSIKKFKVGQIYL